MQKYRVPDAGRLVIRKVVTVPSLSLPPTAGITACVALKFTEVITLVAVGGVFTTGIVYVAVLLSNDELSVAV